MTKRERRDAHAWRRCSYCGLFVSYADFDSGAAKTDFTPDTAFTSERVEAYHVRCHEAFEKRYAEACIAHKRPAAQNPLANKESAPTKDGASE